MSLAPRSIAISPSKAHGGRFRGSILNLCALDKCKRLPNTRNGARGPCAGGNAIVNKCRFRAVRITKSWLSKKLGIFYM